MIAPLRVEDSWTSLGDLKKQRFEDIWLGQAAADIRSVKVSDFPVCSTCELVEYCARCPGLVSLDGGDSDIMGPSLMNCRIARAVKEVRDAGM